MLSCKLSWLLPGVIVIVVVGTICGAFQLRVCTRARITWTVDDENQESRERKLERGLGQWVCVVCHWIKHGQADWISRVMWCFEASQGHKTTSHRVPSSHAHAQCLNAIWRWAVLPYILLSVCLPCVLNRLDLAWIYGVSFAIVVARRSKPVWEGKPLLIDFPEEKDKDWDIDCLSKNQYFCFARCCSWINSPILKAKRDQLRVLFYDTYTLIITLPYWKKKLGPLSDRRGHFQCEARAPCFCHATLAQGGGPVLLRETPRKLKSGSGEDHPWIADCGGWSIG